MMAGSGLGTWIFLSMVDIAWHCAQLACPIHQPNPARC